MPLLGQCVHKRMFVKILVFSFSAPHKQYFSIRRNVFLRKINVVVRNGYAISAFFRTAVIRLILTALYAAGCENTGKTPRRSLVPVVYGAAVKIGDRFFHISVMRTPQHNERKFAGRQTGSV